MVSDHSEHIILFLSGGGATWVISALTSTMPPLPTDSNYFMKWLWAFLHAVGANLDKVHVPGSPSDVAATQTKQP